MQQAVTRLWRRQKIPLSCHNNPNLFEDGATLARTGEKRKGAGEKKEERRGREADSWLSVINAATSLGSV